MVLDGFRSFHVLVTTVAPRSRQLSEENLYLNGFITFNSCLLLPTTKFRGHI